ncbi:MAG: hypothetical protein V7603_5627 [Micromonosporaceae bacterium]
MTTMTYAPTVPTATVAQQQLSPYGLFGDILGAVAPIAGQAVGGLTGNSQLGAGIGGVGQILSGLLPFQAAPGSTAPGAISPQQTQQTQQQIAAQVAQAHAQAQVTAAQLVQALLVHAAQLAQLIRATQIAQATQMAVNQAAGLGANANMLPFAGASGGLAGLLGTVDAGPVTFGRIPGITG